MKIKVRENLYKIKMKEINTKVRESPNEALKPAKAKKEKRKTLNKTKQNERNQLL